jgi:hypothetical protein
MKRPFAEARPGLPDQLDENNALRSRQAPLADFLAAQIFKPLGMTRSALGAASALRSGRMDLEKDARSVPSGTADRPGCSRGPSRNRTRTVSSSRHCHRACPVSDLVAEK